VSGHPLWHEKPRGLSIERSMHMHAFLAAFGPTDESTAIIYIAGFACFIIAAFFGSVAGRFAGGGIGLIALGLALWIFPLMWNTVDAAFD
jgi:hypothetical protein